ncbi:MAG: succinylglutamate desuccinylase/aspartoacylase family protein [Deltaproteobacteria bacterium]|nr:succinylglutamate desuccinylase/aspartoacylase family protein [Deltaproteobacteria bacterium]
MHETCTAICSVDLPTGNEVSVVRRRLQGGEGPCVALVAGMRGDAPAGIRVLHDVVRILRAGSGLAGTVDIYPCANPVAAHGGRRTWPFFDVDLKRVFPGRPDGSPPDRVAHALATHLKEADVVVEVDDAGTGFRACVHAQVRRGWARETDLAVRSGVRVVWERTPGPLLSGAFAASLPTVVALRGGAGHRLEERSDAAMVEIVLGLLGVAGLVAAVPQPATPCLEVGDAEVVPVRAEAGGLFIPGCEPGAQVAQGEALGAVVDPIAVEELEVLVAPRAGRVLAMREQPVVYPGSTIARIVIPLELPA